MAEWRAVPGYEGYEVSDQGEVRVTVRQRPDRHGYPHVVIGRRNVSVHSLVLLAFAGERPEGAEGRHLNDDRTDNRAANLAWGSRSENQQDAVRNGRHHKAARTTCKHGHPYDEENTRIRLSDGARICRRCENERAAARRERD